MAKCRYKNCPEEGYTWFSGCCCARHQSAYQRSISRSTGGRIVSWSSRPTPNRMHGVDNRKGSGGE